MKIFILVNSRNLSGGTELLYQLFYSLSQIHEQTYISFFPEETSSISLNRFAVYEPLALQVEDDINNVVIIPESATILSKKFKYAKKVIFWMSVDNFLRRKGDNIFVDSLKYYGSLFSSRAPLSSLSKFVHLTQSYYAQLFLEKHGLSGLYIGDYLADNFFASSAFSPSDKNNVVCFNPKKGSRYTNQLIKCMPSVDFIPIIDMTPEEVKNTLATSKVYLDFGHHPGKDRIPREAAMSGCVVITSTFGSAKNNIDINIPQIFKFNPKTDLVKCTHMIDFCFDHYTYSFNSQESYRSSILQEKQEFISNVAQFYELIKV